MVSFFGNLGVVVGSLCGQFEGLRGYALWSARVTFLSLWGSWWGHFLVNLGVIEGSLFGHFGGHRGVTFWSLWGYLFGHVWGHFGGHGAVTI